MDFTPLETFLARVPAIVGPIGKGSDQPGTWWVKFAINIEHELAWRVVQEFGHVLNYVSLDERLPTVFMPVSPPPYIDGGPRESKEKHNQLESLLEGKTKCTNFRVY